MSSKLLSVPHVRLCTLRYSTSFLLKILQLSLGYARGLIFNDLKALKYKVCAGILWDRKVNFAAYRNDKNELMVLVSSIEVEVDIFALYRYRWSIERLFKHLKSGGFDIEKSHLVNLDRFKKLLVVTAIASALIVKNGLIQNSLNPIRIKLQKTTEKQLFSLFTYGFDHIKNIFYQSIINSCNSTNTHLINTSKNRTSYYLLCLPTKIVGYYGRRVSKAAQSTKCHMITRIPQCGLSHLCYSDKVIKYIRAIFIPAS